MTDQTTRLSRRAFLGGGGGLTFALAAPAIIRPARAAASLTLADPGGPYSAGYRKAFYNPFEKATGIRVINVARDAEPTAQFKAMVETRAYTWDVCTLTQSARDILSRQDLLAPVGFGPAEAPGLMPGALTPVWLGVDVYSTILAYRRDRMKAPPRSWADFWDVKNFPGRRALRKSPIDTLEQALLADGVPLGKLYPLDVDRAFRSLDSIKPHIDVWWTSGAQSSQLLQSGDVDMIPTWNARAQAAIDGGAPVSLVWNAGLYSIEGWSIPKGCQKLDAAQQFVKFCAGAAQQAQYTEILAYGPTNLDAYAIIPAERARSLPTAPENLKLMTVANEDWWSANRSAMTERFNTWILS